MPLGEQLRREEQHHMALAAEEQPWMDLLLGSLRAA